MKNYKKSCRICLKNPGSRENIQLFESKENLLPATIVSNLANVLIIKQDNLPQQLCKKCWIKVHESFLLIQLIQGSDKFLRDNLFNSSSALVKAENLENVEEIDVKPELFVFTDILECNESESNKIKAEEDDNIQKEVLNNDDNKGQEGKIPSNPKCCICRFVCQSDEELAKHVQEIHPEPKHKKIIHNKPITCTYCYKGFIGNRSYLDHFKVPYLSRNHQCSECGQTFSNSTGLKYHEVIHKATKDVICDVCKKPFRSERNLRRHMKTHDDKNKLQCDLCSSLFAEKGQLEYHLKSHMNIKEYLCTICGRGFVHNNLLKLHMRRHTGERPHKCDICSKAYKHNTDLRRHKYEHEGIKPFKCGFCDRTFYQRSNMKVHERVHTGDTPFSCSLCGEKFKFHAHWKSHERKYHGQGALMKQEIS